MSSSATTRSDTEAPVLCSGDLYIFPSHDVIRRAVNDIPYGDNQDCLSSRLRPYADEISVVYMTCDLTNPRSFVRVSRTDGTGSSGACSYLDVLGPPCFTTPTGDIEEVLLPPRFTASSVMTGLDKLNDKILDPRAYTSPELKKLWSTIMSNQGWVAQVITRLQRQTEAPTQGQAAQSDSD